METEARKCAERVRSADALRRLGEATLIAALCDLAEVYSVTGEDLLEVLAEKRIRVGGPGTPSVSEFLSLEVAGLLRCTPTAAGHRVVEALNLKHRHPRLFEAVLACEVDADRALRAAGKCGDLGADAAARVTEAWLPRQARLGWAAAFTLLDRLIIEADAEAAAEREERARADRGVHVWGLSDGCLNLTGRLDVLDARYLDAAVERMAELLEPTCPGLSRQQRRAKALGVLAHPAYALALLQQAAQPELSAALPARPEPEASTPKAQELAGGAPPDPEPTADHPESEPVEPERLEPDAESVGGTQRHDPHGCLGHLCGAVSVPAARLAPQIGVAVHLHVDAMGELTGAARVERAGWLTASLVAELLAGARVTVQPVIDLSQVEPQDGYVPKVGMRRAVGYAMAHELFPFSNRSSDGLDLDHTVAFAPGRRGQTRLGNLVPLSRRAHRAKTAGAWRSSQPGPATVVWRSPLGYRYEVTPSGTRLLE